MRLIKAIKGNGYNLNNLINFRMIYGISELGFKDISLIVEDETIYCLSPVLYESNIELINILDGHNLEFPYRFPEFISKDAVFLLLRYYGCASIDIDYNNVIQLLILCIFWFEDELGEKCLNYLQKNMNINLCVELFRSISHFDESIISRVLKRFDFFLKAHSYTFIYTGILISF